MSDVEVVKAMLARAGISYRECAVRAALREKQGEPNVFEQVAPPHIRIEVEGGYPGFFTRFEFSTEGALVAVESWE